MCDESENEVEIKLENPDQPIDVVPDQTNIATKLERLKRGLVSDTLRMTENRIPSVKDSQIVYSLKSGRFGASDPLRKRSKLFRSAVSRFAPPYYFWHKETLNELKFKPIVEAYPHPIKEEFTDENQVYCVWCHLIVNTEEYDFHRTNCCKKRFDYLDKGYYRCDSCKEGFLNDNDHRRHVSLHFPSQILAEGEIEIEKQDEFDSQKNQQVICRDQSKRRK